MTSKRKHSRRAFLRGTAARDAMAARVDEGLPEAVAGGCQPPGAEGGLLRVARRAMGSQFEVFFNVGEYPDATEAALAALDEVDRLEAQLSVFRPTSDVSRINRLAASESVVVEAGLFELLQLAVRLAAETDGALDVTAGPLSEVWGFSRRKGEVPNQRQLADALTRVGSDKLELDTQNHTVRFRTSGMTINLGAIGKGYALDRCAAMLEARGIRNFMIHGGQSSIVVRGSAATASPIAQGESAGWIVGVHDPSGRGGRLAEIRLRDRGLGTSGSEKQFFRHQGRRLSHVLDPRTGWPAEGLLAATVVAPTAAVADGLATALFVMGTQQAMAFCQTRRELAVFLVPSSGRRADVCSHGFAPGELGTRGPSLYI